LGVPVIDESKSLSPPDVCLAALADITGYPTPRAAILCSYQNMTEGVSDA
jgi:hypothetical protein